MSAETDKRSDGETSAIGLQRLHCNRDLINGHSTTTAKSIVQKVEMLERANWFATL